MNELNVTLLVTNSVSTSRRLALTYKSFGVVPLDPPELFQWLYYHPLFINETQNLVNPEGFENEITMLTIQEKLSSGNYFKKSLEIRGIRKLMAQGLEEMALSQISPDELDAKTFVNIEKENSLKEVYGIYEKMNCHFNYPKLLVALYEGLKTGKYDEILSKLILKHARDLDLKGMEKKLFELLLLKTKNEEIQSSHKSFEETVQKKKSQFTLCSKITEEALVADMLLWMQKHSLDCAQNAVLVLDYQKYAPIFYHLSLKHNLPIYLANGLRFNEFTFFEKFISEMVNARQKQLPLEVVVKSIFPRNNNELEDVFLGKAAKILRELINHQNALKFSSFSKVYDIFLERLQSLAVTAKELGQDENGMFIGRYADFQHLNLSNLAILGLDSAHYPVKKHLNALLTDEERKALNAKLSCHLQTSDDLTGGEILEEIIGNVQGEVYLGLTSHNTDTGKIKVPSSLFNKILTYSGKTASLKEVYSACGISPDLLTDYDHENPFVEMASSEEVIRSKKDLEKRLFSPKVTEDDYGVFEVETPRVSATALERFFKCPFKYYLMDLKKLEMPEVEEEDVTFWLDAMTFGTYIHGVYERLLKSFLGRNTGYASYLKSLTVSAVNEAMMETEKEEKIDKFRPEVPEHIKNLDRDIIREYGLTFIEKEIEYADEGFYPIAVEEDFREKDVNILGIQLSGKIDRIDTNGKGAYRIIDYKSGRNRHKDRYSDMFIDSQEYVHVQHGLYSVAARAVLGEKITSIEAGYYFATDNGQWQREMRDETVFLKKFQQIMELYKKQVEGQKFYKNPEHCKRCDVKNLCYNRTKNREDVLLQTKEIKSILGLVYGR